MVIYMDRYVFLFVHFRIYYLAKLCIHFFSFCVVCHYILVLIVFIIIDFTGKNPTEEYLEGMMNEAPGPINFTMFLTLFGERLQGTDPEEVIKNAFACFDEDNAGYISEERLRELLVTMGDRFTDEEVPFLATLCTLKN